MGGDGRPFRLAVAGSRQLMDAAFVAARLGRLAAARLPDVVVLHGGCRGCDQLAARWAAGAGLATEPHDVLGQAAVESADALVAFRTADSRGTTDCVGRGVMSPGGRVQVVVFDLELDGAGLVRRVFGRTDYNRRPLDRAVHLPANLA